MSKDLGIRFALVAAVVVAYLVAAHNNFHNSVVAPVAVAAVALIMFWPRRSHQQGQRSARRELRRASDDARR